MDFALHEAVTFETAQRLGQHFLRDAADGALQFGIPHRTERQDLDNEGRPFIGDSIEHEPGWTLWFQNRRRGFSHGSFVS